MGELTNAQPLAEIRGPKSYLFYGPGGSGKTYLATKHPGKKKLFLDIDQRLHELLALMTPEEVSRIEVWTPGVTLGSPNIQIVEADPRRKDIYQGTKIASEPQGYKKTVAVLNELLDLAYKSKKGEAEWPYDCVVLDSLTRLVDHLIYLVLYKAGAVQMTQTLFGVEGRNLKELITGFLQLPCDRILIAHDIHIEKRDEDTGALIYERIRPHVFGSDALRNELNTLFSETYYFLGRQRDGKYLIQTATDRLAPARTAKKLDFEQIVDPVKIFA